MLVLVRSTHRSQKHLLKGAEINAGDSSLPKALAFNSRLKANPALSKCRGATLEAAAAAVSLQVVVTTCLLRPVHPAPILLPPPRRPQPDRRPPKRLWGAHIRVHCATWSLITLAI